MTPPLTWYHATASAPERDRLIGDRSCDVCVIGGGLAGVSTALHCAERGLDTVLLEAETIGYGASGRNGGQVLQSLSADVSVVERQVGRDGTRMFFDMAREAVEDLKDRAARHAPDADLRFGYLHATLNERQFDGMRGVCEAWQAWGYAGPKMIRGAELREWIGSDRFMGAMVDPESGQIHPLRYLYGLARGAEAAGATLFEHSAVLDVDGTVVRTAGGAVTARTVVYCGNAYLGGLVAKLRAKVMPVASFVAVTEPLAEELAAKLFPQDVAVADCNVALDYFRLTEDRRLLFGSGASYSAITPPGLEGTMRRKIARVFPDLSDVRIDHLWGGLIGITINRIPDIGRTAPNVFHAQGFSGQGVVLTGLAGKIIAEAITGDDSRLKLFEKVRHLPFPGGPLRMPALVAGMAWVKARDWLGI
ncbi:MAG: FAD-binding oxidoreductase [Thalassobaculaceae bacterium]|nr:FAD-binding oxidoreductase [Thalassobaculaceae bacterium]